MQNWSSVSELLLNWPTFNNSDVAAEIWARLPYVVLWCIWRQRNDVIFNNGTADTRKLMLIIKATSWTWLNMSERAMDLRKKIQFTDLLFGWRYVMSEQW
ncbi:hypothetical protein FRX31_007741 [Thalictrum thalictroides]|uniref:Reverse transcriptase zinc-binding domain n=1 Tax=Thalictrum thalictroides TaxID=46969 RepID=A0A7J6X2W4_THATH|nr:hypothetical protein FRX31_007741 [Thalictrum thalictroides]